MSDSVTIDGITVGYSQIVRNDIRNTYLKFDEDTLLLISKRRLKNPQELIKKHKTWVIKNYLQVTGKMHFFDEGRIFYQGTPFTVERQFYAGRPTVSINSENSCVIVKAANGVSAHAAIVKQIRKMSLDYSSSQANAKAAQIGVNISSVKVRKTKRWGACNSKKSISFNSFISMLPTDISDYVVSHEVAHLKELNHSKRFWDIVRELSPEYKRLRKELQKYDNTERPIFNNMGGYPDIGHI